MERKEPVQEICLYLFHKLSLFLSLITQLKSSGHQRAVPSPADHLSSFCPSSLVLGLAAMAYVSFGFNGGKDIILLE